MPVRVGKEGLVIDGRPFPLWSGAVHYWRLDRGVWETVLHRVLDMGFRCVETYIPWGVHENPDGTFDFTGRKDVGAFLDLAARPGLKAIVRPGPHINAEITGFGYPDRILRDPAFFARGPRGNPIWVPVTPRMFPALSYAGERLYAEFDKYVAALAPILAPRTHPNGPIVAVQADNEMTLFFRTGAFDMDYCDAALSEYREFLENRYGSVGRLNKAYGTAFEAFRNVRPPERFDAKTPRDLPWYLDWAEFKELYMRRAVARVAAILRGHGLGDVPVTHNYPLGAHRSPLDLPALEAEVDLAGMDMYYQREDYASLKRRCVMLCGSSRLPHAPEFSSGCYHAWPPIDLFDQEFTTLCAIMHGLKGFNFYMLCDRERWYGAPIRRDGSVDGRRFDFFRRLTRLARACRGAARRADAVLLTTRFYGRLESLSNAFEPLSPMLLSAMGLDSAATCLRRDFGLARPLAATHAGLQNALFDGLAGARIAFDLAEPERPVGNLSRYRLAVIPGLEIIGRPAAEALLGFVAAGGTLVLGPDVPRYNESGKPERTLLRALAGEYSELPGVPSARSYAVGKGSVVVATDLDETAKDPVAIPRLLGAAARRAGCRPLPDPGDPAIDAAFHAGKKEILWFANPTNDDREAVLSLNGTRFLEDLWSGEAFESGGTFRVPLRAWTVRPLEMAAR
jgi:beta-galactosidase